LVSRRAFLILLLCQGTYYCFGQAQAQIVLTITGGAWSVVISNANLSGGAGTDFTPTLESASDVIDIAITATAANGRYRVDVHRTDTIWDASLHLYIRRTTDGTTGGGSQPSITGGTTYMEITTADKEFFRGRRTRTGIKVQLELDGLSIYNILPTIYTTTVTYTTVDA
jgi:hypothetical protein